MNDRYYNDSIYEDDSYIRDTSFPGNTIDLPMEQSYIENILRLNKGKKVKVHMTFNGSNDKLFTGIIKQAGRDHLIISDPTTGKWNMLLMIYLDYVEFDEDIKYQL